MLNSCKGLGGGAPTWTTLIWPDPRTSSGFLAPQPRKPAYGPRPIVLEPLKFPAEARTSPSSTPPPYAPLASSPYIFLRPSLFFSYLNKSLCPCAPHFFSYNSRIWPALNTSWASLILRLLD